MMEYFTYKKIKKHQTEKAAATQVQTPIINEEDENYLERIISAEGTPPPLPARPTGLDNGVVGDSTGNESQMVVHDPEAAADRENQEKAKSKSKGKGKGKEKETEKPKDEKKGSRLSFIQRTFTKKDKNRDGLQPKAPVSPEEAAREEDDINKILDDLNLAAVNNRAFSISKESQHLVQQFTVILKDLMNGVPTAYDDLVRLLDDSQGTLAKSYDHLPSYLQKLVTQLPNKLTSNLAPELLAVAAEAQGLNAAGGSAATTSAAGGGLMGAAKSFLKPNSLKDLVTKPGAVASMLKAIMNVLKLRWPAFMGTNVLLSLGLFVLLFVFWYCHKRGREVRLAGEKLVDSEGRIIELDDDPMLERERRQSNEGPRTPRNRSPRRGSRSPERRTREAERRVRTPERGTREPEGTRTPERSAEYANGASTSSGKRNGAKERRH